MMRINMAPQPGEPAFTREGNPIEIDGVWYFLTIIPTESKGIIIVRLTHYKSGALVSREDLSLGRRTAEEVVARVGTAKIVERASKLPVINLHAPWIPLP